MNVKVVIHVLLIPHALMQLDLTCAIVIMDTGRMAMFVKVLCKYKGISTYKCDSLYIVTDIDECLEQSANCTTHGQCINTDGGYKCQCDEGFTMQWSVCIG